MSSVFLSINNSDNNPYSKLKDSFESHSLQDLEEGSIKSLNLDRKVKHLVRDKICYKMLYFFYYYYYHFYYYLMLACLYLWNFC